MVNQREINPSEESPKVSADSHLEKKKSRSPARGLLGGALVLGLLGGAALLPQLFDSLEEVPQVVGQTRQAAVETMASSGLAPEFVFEHHENVEQGKVFSVQPSAGEKVEPGVESVKVFVSLGPERVREEPAVAEPEPQWWPDGYFPVGTNAAFRWAEPTGNPCGRSACIFWRAEVVTKTGCPSGVYAKINILEGVNVVSWTNDTLAALSPNQVGKLTFTKYGMGDRGWKYEAEVVELNCR